MTIVSVASDIHLEFSPCELPGGDILLLCGDTFVADYLREARNDADARAQKKRYRDFCAKELKKYHRVLAISGNHESYKGTLTDTPELIRDLFSEFAPTASFLDNQSVEIDGVRFIGSTLWATYGYGTPNELCILEGLNDFRQICVPSGNGLRRFNVKDAYNLHQEALAFLKEAVQTELSCVVFTHHAPTYLACNRKRFPDGSMDDAYASNQSEFILANPGIKCWFAGHSHYRYRTKIGETKVASNARGYYGHERSATAFDPTECDFQLETFEFLA